MVVVVVGLAVGDLVAVRVQGVPAQADHRQGERQPCCAVCQGIKGAKCKPYVPLACGEGIADIDCGDGFDKEGDEDIGEADVGEEQIGGALLEVI